MATSWAIEQGFLTAFSFIGFVLVTIPLAWHVEAWNIGCILYIFWTGSQCLIQFINHIVWRDNAINWAPVWCDITVRFSYIARIGIIAASLVIARRLCKIATGTTVCSTRSDRRRAIITDCCIGLGIPAAQLIIFYFVQGHRFDIYEGIGCLNTPPNTIPLVFLYTAWPIAIGFVSATYCVLTLRAFMKRRKQFSELLASNNNLSFNRYIRLMAMAVIEIVCTIPLCAYIIWVDMSQDIYQWKGLADLHLGFGRVRQYPLEIWLTFGVRRAFESSEWFVIGCAITFFLIFGLAEEARKHYRSAYTTVAKRVGLSTGGVVSTGAFSTSKGSKVTSSGFGRVTIPTFIQRNASKRDSLDSFSDRLSSAISVGDFPAYDEEKAQPYSPTDSSAGSSTYLPTPADDTKSHMDQLKVPEMPALPEPVHDIETVQRHTPDVPSPVRHSADMV